MIQQEEKRSEGREMQRSCRSLQAGAAEPDRLIVLDLFTSQSVTVGFEKWKTPSPSVFVLRLIYPSQTGCVGMTA